MSRGTKDIKQLIQKNRGDSDGETQKLAQLNQDDQELIQILKAKIDQQNKELESRHFDVASIHRNFQQLSEQYMTEKKKVNKLEEQIREQQQKITEYEEIANIKEQMLKDLEAYREKRLEGEMQTKSELLQIIDKHKRELAEKESKLLEKEAEIKKLNFTNKAEALDRDKKLQTIQKDIQVKDEIIQQLKDNILTLQHQEVTNKQSAQKLEVLIHELKRENSRISKDNTELTNTLDLLTEKNSNLEEQLTMLSNTCKKYEEDLVKLLETQQAMEKQKQSISELESKLHTGTLKLTSLESKIREKDMENSMYLNDALSKDERIKEMRQVLIKSEENQQQLKIMLESLELQTREYEEFKQNITKKYQDLEKENAILTSTITMLQAQLGKYQNSESSLSSENTSLRDKVEAANRYAIINMGLQNSLSQLQEQMNDLQKLLSVHHEKVKFLEGEQERLMSTLEMERKEKMDISAKLDFINSEYQNLMQQQTKSNTEIEKLQQEIQEKQILENSLKHQNEELTEKLKALDQDVLNNKLKEMEKHTLNVISQLLRTEDAIEASLTCTSCMKQINNARILVPCGHVFCNPCCGKMRTCIDCEEQVESIIKTDLIDNFISKQSVKKQTLLSLQKYFKEERS